MNTYSGLHHNLKQIIKKTAFFIGEIITVSQKSQKNLSFPHRQGTGPSQSWRSAFATILMPCGTTHAHRSRV